MQFDHLRCVGGRYVNGGELGAVASESQARTAFFRLHNGGCRGPGLNSSDICGSGSTRNTARRRSCNT
jgi:hypothetical protein